jgi:cytochrome c nitrite reductase small subunit
MKPLPLILGILLLVAALGVFAWFTDAPAYLGHEASTCNNCHVMDAQYENWYHAAHARFAVCTDCHLPHQNIVSYYLYKGYSGLRDVYSFTTKTYPAAIRATAQTDAILQANCIRCHTDTVESLFAGLQPFDRRCWDCHRAVAHGNRGMSLTSYQDSEIYTK